MSIASSLMSVTVSRVLDAVLIQSFFTGQFSRSQPGQRWLGVIND